MDVVYTATLSPCNLCLCTQPTPSPPVPPMIRVPYQAVPWDGKHYDWAKVRAELQGLPGPPRHTL